MHHPVFRDKAVNHDPREVFIAELFRKRGEHNVFHDYYHALVQALYDAGLSRNVYCVNIDAVIAALLLKMMWRPYRAGTFTEERPRDSGIHGVPLRPHDRLRRRDRGPPESRTQHGHAHAASDCRFVA